MYYHIIISTFSMEAHFLGNRKMVILAEICAISGVVGLRSLVALRSEKLWVMHYQILQHLRSDLRNTGKYRPFRPNPLGHLLPVGIQASPCLTSLVVNPCGARACFWFSHYIVVSAPAGAGGGRWSLSLRAFKTCLAREEPGVVPLRSWSSIRNCTWRIVFSDSNAD